MSAKCFVCIGFEVGSLDEGLKLTVYIVTKSRDIDNFSLDVIP